MTPLTGIDGLLLDMDGVLGVSWTPLPGAAEAVTRVHAAGVPLRVLTNTTALPQARFGEVLREAGYPFADEDILTASVLAGVWLREQRQGARVFLIGDAQAEDLAGVELVGADEAPDIVLVSGADDSFCFATFNRVLALLRDGAELVAMHRNLLWMTSTRSACRRSASPWWATTWRTTCSPHRPSASPACWCARASSVRTSWPARRARRTSSPVPSSTCRSCSESERRLVLVFPPSSPIIEAVNFIVRARGRVAAQGARRKG